jgi:hypothetical protein
MNAPGIGEGPIAGFVNSIKKFIIHKWHGIATLPKRLLTS